MPPATVSVAAMTCQRDYHHYKWYSLFCYYPFAKGLAHKAASDARLLGFEQVYLLLCI